MNKRAMLFPGQGAQYPGMGMAFSSRYPESEAIFDRANEVLGFDLKQICFHGPAEQLNRTDICQPGILTTSIAIMEVLKSRHGLKPTLFHGTAGLSLGEYTALVFAGVLEFEDAVLLVAKRGKYMQQDSTKNPSGMMSLIGADEEKVDELCRRAGKSGVLVPANYLAPSQIAVSGSNDALDSAESMLKELGIRRGIRLSVAGAFHSPLMREGAEKLKAKLANTAFNSPAIPFASNVKGDLVDDPETIRECLGKQVTSPVLWKDTMSGFINAGFNEFYEPGPGKFLSGILKKTDRSLITFTLDDPEELETFLGSWFENNGMDNGREQE